MSDDRTRRFGDDEGRARTRRLAPDDDAYEVGPPPDLGRSGGDDAWQDERDERPVRAQPPQRAAGPAEPGPARAPALAGAAGEPPAGAQWPVYLGIAVLFFVGGLLAMAAVSANAEEQDGLVSAAALQQAQADVAARDARVAELEQQLAAAQAAQAGAEQGTTDQAATDQAAAEQAAADQAAAAAAAQQALDQRSAALDGRQAELDQRAAALDARAAEIEAAASQTGVEVPDLGLEVPSELPADLPSVDETRNVLERVRDALQGLFD